MIVKAFAIIVITGNAMITMKYEKKQNKFLSHQFCFMPVGVKLHVHRRNLGERAEPSKPGPSTCTL